MGTGPYELVTESDRFCEGEEIRGLLAERAAEAGHHHRRPVVDNNTRAAMLQTGEAQFAFPVPYEQAAILEKNTKLELVASPSIMQRYISMNVTQKPFDNPKVREAINYAINRRAGEGRFCGLCHPGHRRAAAGYRVCAKLSAVAVRSGQSARAAERGGLSERL